jgi:hypothetical protein
LLSLNTISRALITSAMKIARIVITIGLPSTIDRMIMSPVSRNRGLPSVSVAASGSLDPGAAGVSWSLNF